MKLIKTSIISLIILLASISFVFAQHSQGVPPEISSALKQGNSISLSNYFNDRIELSIQGKESIYSKSQAKQIMAKFFKENKPTSFSIKHAGGKPQARYVVGKLTCKQQSFRVNFLIKNNSTKPMIHRLNIESD